MPGASQEENRSIPGPFLRGGRFAHRLLGPPWPSRQSRAACVSVGCGGFGKRVRDTDHAEVRGGRGSGPRFGCGGWLRSTGLWGMNPALSWTELRRELVDGTQPGQIRRLVCARGPNPAFQPGLVFRLGDGPRRWGHLNGRLGASPGNPQKQTGRSDDPETTKPTRRWAFLRAVLPEEVFRQSLQALGQAVAAGRSAES